MNGINRVFLMGYLGATPEPHTSKNGKSNVRLNVATHHNKKLDTGEKKPTTVWHRVTVWGKTAERCQSYLDKGSALAIEGYLSKYSYSRDDGEDMTATSIVAREVHFIGNQKRKGAAAESATDQDLDKILQS
jgi:single-strand DNA-binding protein